MFLGKKKRELIARREERGLAILQNHICVCLCTFRRPNQLEKLLSCLLNQETGKLFDYSIVVVDNDSDLSAHDVVIRASSIARIKITYRSEPRQNIALARNKAVQASKGEFIAFIDDDEIPESRWLFTLFVALNRYSADGALGPVCPYFKKWPPAWVLRGRFFERPRYHTGYVLHWESTRTGNCLIKRNVFLKSPDWFRQEFGSGGEDRDFFKRKIEQGYAFIWCNEAAVFESIPPERWNLYVQIKRALIRGKAAYAASTSKAKSLAISAFAMFIYGASLPFLYLFSPLFGYEIFVKYFIAFFDHLGKILSCLKINFVKEKYITT
ncbi:MAG: glycosyltransferase family 2 protein [Candidatus Atribacteria bacterium]|nr:glycosyltransferase family 2 protein [Candidatus Atribacteria bacterium]